MMSKKSLSIFFLLAISLLWTPIVGAATPTINDEANLFTSEQVNTLSQQAKEINDKIKGQVFIVTTTSNTAEPRDFADNYLKTAIGNDQNGSVLLLDMGQREIYISTSGNMIDYLTDRRIDSILDDVYDQMTNANYYANSLKPI